MSYIRENRAVTKSYQKKPKYCKGNSICQQQNTYGCKYSMASIQKKNNKYCVVYYCKDTEGKRKQKWETYDTKM